MKPRSLFFLGLTAAFLLVAAATSLWVVPAWREHGLMRRAAPVQTTLETYRQQHRRYPESLSQLGLVVTEEGPLYYQRETESSYILWFGTTLGESRTFHSTDGRWQ